MLFKICKRQSKPSFHLYILHILMHLSRRLVHVSPMGIQSPKTLLPYHAPEFARPFRNTPKYRLKIANLPTPLQDIPLSNYVHSNRPSVLQPFRDLNVQLIMKRDDMTAGVELGGNKIRKLEFLLADALENGYDSVVTIGGEQSNHCRATAAACRMVGLEPHLILRTRRANQVEKDRKENDSDSFGHVGNILFDRLAGAKIHTCTPGEYGRVGSKALVETLCADLVSASASSSNRKVYPITVGGSNGLGTWGYIEAIKEFMLQLDSNNKSGAETDTDTDIEDIDHVVFACGSGGTATGITLGLSLAFRNANKNVPQMHAVGVCDDPDYFYKEISSIADEMGLDLSEVLSESEYERYTNIEEFVRGLLTVHQGKGLGYASSSAEELEFIVDFAVETGVVLDPVYSGKALFHFIREMQEDPDTYRNSRVVFWHTGGSLGVYEKIQSLENVLKTVSPVERINVYGKK